MATLRTRETGNCGSVYGKEKEILYFPKQQNGGKAHWAMYSVGTKGTFPEESKAARAWEWSLTCT